jgi:hypothetical protein
VACRQMLERLIERGRGIGTRVECDHTRILRRSTAAAIGLQSHRRNRNQADFRARFWHVL